MRRKPSTTSFRVVDTPLLGLFRSRDAGKELERAGVTVHYQEQFMDAPTLVGGVMPTRQSGVSVHPPHLPCF